MHFLIFKVVYFPKILSAKTFMYVFSPSTCHMGPHITLPDTTIQIIFGEEHQLLRSSVRSFLYSYVTASL